MDCCECDCSEGKNEDEICCPKFDPKKWDKKTLVWKNKRFIKRSVLQIMHIPLNFGPAITSLISKAEKAKALPKGADFLSLAYDPSPWKSELYVSVTKQVSGAENALLSGKFFARVFDGPYNAVPEWLKETEKGLKGKTPEKCYVHYAYCPKCSKKYGHNYAIVFAKIA